MLKVHGEAEGPPSEVRTCVAAGNIMTNKGGARLYLIVSYKPLIFLCISGIKNHN